MILISFYLRDVVVYLPVYSVPTRCITAELLIFKVPSRTKRGSDGQVSSIGRRAATFSPPYMTSPSSCLLEEVSGEDQVLRGRIHRTFQAWNPDGPMGLLQSPSVGHTCLTSSIMWLQMFLINTQGGSHIAESISSTERSGFYMWFME